MRYILIWLICMTTSLSAACGNEYSFEGSWASDVGMIVIVESGDNLWDMYWNSGNAISLHEEGGKLVSSRNGIVIQNNNDRLEMVLKTDVSRDVIALTRVND